MRIVRRVRADVMVSFLAAIATGACVEAFDGSNVQLDLAGGVQTNTPPGTASAPDQPPENTHYVLYAVDNVYRTNADGTTVIDMAGQPVIERTYLFEVKQFKVRPVIDTSSPCLIDIEATRFPGIHVTQYAAAVRAQTGITDPFAPNQNYDDVVDVLTADRRVSNLSQLQTSMKAVTSTADFAYPATASGCGVDPQLIPPPSCTDPASNAQRLAQCRALWQANPGWYEGSDKVFTLPLSGEFYGMVEGMNPINGGFVGGASFFVDDNLVGLDAYLMNWQYDDLDHDGQPDFPGTLPAAERSPTGYVYMQGTPEKLTRGTIAVSLTHATNPRITAQMVVFPNLGTDDVNF
jgi:hypothetical protein